MSIIYNQRKTEKEENIVKKKENLQKYNLCVLMIFLGLVFRRHRIVPDNLLCSDYSDIFHIFELSDIENYDVLLTLRLDYSVCQ